MCGAFAWGARRGRVTRPEPDRPGTSRGQTGIEARRCDADAASAARPACVAQLTERQGRRLQLGAGACPHPTFLGKAAAMKTACGLEAAGADVVLPPSCPSPDCARRLLGLLEGCAASINRAAAEEAALYTALESGAGRTEAEGLQGAHYLAPAGPLLTLPRAVSCIALGIIMGAFVPC